ncbi:MAG: DsbA family protein [Lactobacillus sp.]|jgi:hypothetical protein|nr:DsbA family protein [Lactobacillus sp.]MCH3989747.1 DsbA family protein [Lactobacillus sp.]MCH4068087.1 DsbA family protein [Lactobacillus sp.]MCI1303957.1 DsbA family protein [Lactobacillus sp.]MCI1330017.1 DsbA family protein [Lactobacillus sp.]
MFEVFFFINPLGTLCYHNEQTVISALNEHNLSASYHMVPVVSLDNIKTYLMRRGCSGNCLDEFNQAAEAMRQAQTDFYTLKMLAGNKKARSFIFDLQAKLAKQEAFSQLLANQLLEQLDVKPENIASHYHSPFVSKAIEKDKQIVAQFGIQTTPTTVIYNYAQNKTGYIFEGAISRSDLAPVLTTNNSQQIHLI